MWEVNNPFCEEIWRFYKNPEKSGEKIRKPDSEISGKENYHIIFEKKTIHSVKKYDQTV